MSLTKIPGFALDTTSNVTFANANVTGNLTSGNSNLGNLTTSNYFSGNGSLLTSITGGNVTGQVGNSLVAGTVYNNAQPNITSVGTLTSLSVTGNVTAGNVLTDHLYYSNGVAWSLGTVYSNSNVASYLPTYTGNITAGNVNAGNLLTANYHSGNGSLLTSLTGANVTGQVGNSLIAGTVYTNAQPNITSVGTLTSLSVTANITSGNITGGNLVKANYFQGDGSLLTGIISSYSNTNVAAYLPTYTGNISGGNLSLTGNVTSTLNVTGNANVGNLNTTGSINANNLTLTGNLIVGGTTTYVNSTVTDIVDPLIELGGGSNGALLTTGDGKDRGLFLHRYEGISGSGGKIVDSFMGWSNSAYEFMFASNATVSSDVVTVNNYGNVHANYFIGNGSALTGIAATTAVSLINGSSNVIVTNNGNVTLGVGGNASIMTVTSTGANFGGYITTTGNVIAGNSVTANYFVGSGQYLTGLGSLSNGNSNISILQNGNVIVSAGGSFGILQVSSVNAQVGGNFTVTGNLVANTITSNGFANINGTVTAVNANLGNLATANYFNGTLTTLSSAQPNITSVGSLTSLTVTGNISSGNANLGNLAKANYFQGDGGLLSNIGAPNLVFLGTSNINIPVTNGNITVTVAGNANTVVFTGTGVNIAGYTTITGNLTAANASLGNLITANYITINNNANVTGNLTAGNANLGNLVTANYFTGIHANGNSNVSIPSSNGNVNISATGVANVVVVTGTGVNVAGTLNSTGNLTALNASLGNLVTSNYFSGKFDSLSNSQPNITSVGTLLNITVSTNANISGNLFVGNSTSNVLIANTGIITSTGNITAANASLGNLTTSNYFAGVLTTASQPNITSIGILGNLTVTNNVSANVLTTGTGTNGNLTINPDGTGQLVITSDTPVTLQGNTLTSNGNVIFSGSNISLGAVGNVHITGGSTNQYLKTDGSGNLSWGTPSGGGGGGTALTYTAATTPPGTANIADQWYNTSSDVLYEYVSDGTTSYWVDVTTPTVSSAASSGGGTNLLVKNQGSNLTATANTLNFTGSGVIATNSSNVVTVTVPGGITAQDLLSPFMLMGA